MKNNNIIRPTGLKGGEKINRMRSLMGMAPINEGITRSVLELNKLGPDGRVYGIVRENHEYYIKIANNKPNLVVEDFQYIGGLKNKKDVVYESYAKATKQLNLKFISLNDALGVKGEINTLKNDNLVGEAFESYNEAPKKSQPDTTLGTVGEIGKNDGHDTEIITDAGETGNPDVKTPPVVEEDDVVEGEEGIDEGPEELKAYQEKKAKDDKTLGDINDFKDYERSQKDEEVEMTEGERAIDRMILEGRVEVAVVEETIEEPIVERRLSIATALQKIDEGTISQKKK